MTAKIRWFRERLGSGSLPWPVLVAVGAAAVAILLAGRATTAEAAGPEATPAGSVQSVVLAPVADPTVGGLLPQQHQSVPSAAQLGRDMVRALGTRVVQPVVERVTATATGAPGGSAILDPTAAAVSRVVTPLRGLVGAPPESGASGTEPAKPAVHALAGAATPLPGHAVNALWTSLRAVGSWLSRSPGAFPTLPGMPSPAPLGLPATIISAVGGATAPGSSALGAAAGLWVLLLRARARPGSPTPVEQTDLVPLVERPG